MENLTKEQKEQDTFIDNLFETVVNYVSRANKTDYKPTQHERYYFNEIRKYLENMNNWF